MTDGSLLVRTIAAELRNRSFGYPPAYISPDEADRLAGAIALAVRDRWTLTERKRP